MIKIIENKDAFWKKFGFENLEPDEYKRRTTAVELGFLSAVGGVCYTLLYMSFGFTSLTIAVIAYVLTFTANLLILLLTKNYSFFKTSQLLACTFLPVLAQLLVGGFIQGSAVALSAFLSPAGALLFTNRHVARRYFYMFVVLIIAIGIWEYFYIKPTIALPRYIIILFFVTNIVTTFSIIYFILESFLTKLDELRNELKQSLENLKATQAQLIQAEKMASLGELTAGIAHEIQNPLNFVNNFSELNTELIEELDDAINNGNAEDMKAIAKSVRDNEQKILYHGRRADSIVKGMLQHSRINAGHKEATDINALTDEYLRLSYHGLRAKDKTFNAGFTTNFDERTGKIFIVPQDISRVLLNLCNNAFYAVKAKKEKVGDAYEPMVSVSTKKINNAVEIVVKDNGSGIPQNIIDKIFQPFFTTKPTGSGTGLGLSISYDIIKVHGGEIKVESTAGEGSTFIIHLPLNA